MPQRDLTEGKVSLHLARLGLPMVLGVAGVISVSIADTYFLGQLGTEELAAISFTFPIVLTVTSLGIGLGAGATSVLSRAIGSGAGSEAKRLATDSVVIAALLSALVCGAGFLLARPLFSLIGAEGEVLGMIVGYMRIWFVGAPFLILPIVLQGLIRANGDSVAPSLIMVGGAAVNVALDPLLIFGVGPIPSLGVEGAGWATLGARAVMMIAAFWVATRRDHLLTRALPSSSEFASSARKVLKVGVPAAGSNAINPVSISIVTAILATYDHQTVAAFGVASRIETFATIPMLALSSAIGPVTGQNWGKGERARSRRAVRDSFFFVVLCGLGLGGAFFFLGGPMAALFSDDTVVQNLARGYLAIVGLTLGGYGIVITASAALNSVDKAVTGLLVTMLRSFVLYVPLAYGASILWPSWVVFAGIALSNMSAGVVVWFWTFRAMRDRGRTGEAVLQAA
ncbi:MATE family efflux transporter [Parvularcula maris]|uniref:MATE family efflux transporter n=1 Tax=Parvularcula maris TaxID=2965077 RepID=A0A9X2L6N5_9PROT|nr:MATE family efflux transporter [Parvularcula maris]MCQ8183939.1 MATE family efflux transporter [Parvularcula maris]